MSKKQISYGNLLMHHTSSHLMSVHAARGHGSSKINHFGETAKWSAYQQQLGYYQNEDYHHQWYKEPVWSGHLLTEKPRDGALMNTTLKLEQVHKKTNLHTELNLCIMNGESEDVVKDEVTIIGGFQEEQLAKSMWWVIICLGTQQNNMLN